jgi:hypothetical protein
MKYLLSDLYIQIFNFLQNVLEPNIIDSMLLKIDTNII